MGPLFTFVPTQRKEKTLKWLNKIWIRPSNRRVKQLIILYRLSLRSIANGECFPNSKENCLSCRIFLQHLIILFLIYFINDSFCVLVLRSLRNPFCLRKISSFRFPFCYCMDIGFNLTKQHEKKSCHVRRKRTTKAHL